MVYQVSLFSMGMELTFTPMLQIWLSTKLQHLEYFSDSCLQCRCSLFLFELDSLQFCVALNEDPSMLAAPEEVFLPKCRTSYDVSFLSCNVFFHSLKIYNWFPCCILWHEFLLKFYLTNSFFYVFWVEEFLYARTPLLVIILKRCVIVQTSCKRHISIWFYVLC